MLKQCRLHVRGKLCARRHSRIERHRTALDLTPRRKDAKEKVFCPEKGGTLIGNGCQTHYLRFDDR
jgi:hypothetical protein